MFEQIKCQYLKQGFSVNISDSKTILLSAILLEILKRNTNRDNKYTVYKVQFIVLCVGGIISNVVSKIKR